MSVGGLRVLRIVLLLLVVRPLPLNAAADDVADAEQLLRNAGVGTDAAALLKFFRQRTLSNVECRQVEGWIRQLGSDQFLQREDASRQLIRRGQSARSFLRLARRDADAEIARRARLCLEAIGPGPGPSLPAAAVRLLARRRPIGTVPTLLAYLPFADESDIEEEVLAALLAVTPPRGPIDGALAKALTDARPLVRAVAARVLGHKGDAEQRARVRTLLKDKDAGVRWRAAQGLLAGREKIAVVALIALLEDAPLPVASQAEESLYLLAGEQAPPLSVYGTSAGNRRKCREAWLAWWNKQGDTVDLARATDGRQLLGFTLGIEFNTGRVWECARDGALRWEITGLSGPMDAQVLPGERLLLAESHGHRVSERDFKGKILWEKKIDGNPTGCQRLANGNTFVSTYMSVMEFARDGKQVYAFKLPAGSNAVRKHRHGHILFAANNEIVELDTAGNRVRAIPLPPHAMYVGIEDLPGDHFLVANSSSGRVLEVDGKGKIVWEAKVAGACGVWRLPTGNTLVATNGRIIEVDRRGKKVWEVASKGYVRRVHRR